MLCHQFHILSLLLHIPQQITCHPCFNHSPPNQHPSQALNPLAVCCCDFHSRYVGFRSEQVGFCISEVLQQDLPCLGSGYGSSRMGDSYDIKGPFCLENCSYIVHSTCWSLVGNMVAVVCLCQSTSIIPIVSSIDK